MDDLLTELDGLSRSFVPLMRDKTQWQVPFPESFAVGPDRIYSAPCEILTRGPGGQNEIAVALYNVRALSPDAAGVLVAIKSVLKPPLIRTVTIRSRTLLLMSNFRGLHGRGRITGSRWAQRIYLTRSLAAMQEVCGTTGTRVYDVARLRHK